MTDCVGPCCPGRLRQTQPDLRLGVWTVILHSLTGGDAGRSTRKSGVVPSSTLLLDNVPNSRTGRGFNGLVVFGATSLALPSRHRQAQRNKIPVQGNCRKIRALREKAGRYRRFDQGRFEKLSDCLGKTIGQIGTT